MSATNRILMTQSLGNMVACEALREGLSVGKYFMFDAAVPSEAIDATLRAVSSEDGPFPKYVPGDWHAYTNACWASNWHRLFADDPNDARGKMGWAGRFTDALTNATEVYNYYSSGDDDVPEPQVDDGPYAAGNYQGTDAIYNPSAGGIYQVQALAGLGWGADDERYYVWDADENPNLGVKRRGDFKSFGVCSEEWQKTLRNCAKNYFGDPTYAFRATIGPYGGFTAVGRETWKCNVFVALRLAECQLPVPAVHHGRLGYNDWPSFYREE